MIELVRNCPKCGSLLSYTTRQAYRRANKKIGECRSCWQKGKPASPKKIAHCIVAFKGHFHSEATKIKCRDAQKLRRLWTDDDKGGCQ